MTGNHPRLSHSQITQQQIRLHWKSSRRRIASIHTLIQEESRGFVDAKKWMKEKHKKSDTIICSHAQALLSSIKFNTSSPDTVTPLISQQTRTLHTEQLVNLHWILLTLIFRATKYTTPLAVA